MKRREDALAISTAPSGQIAASNADVAEAKRQHFASVGVLDELRRKLDAAIATSVLATSPAPAASVDAAVDDTPLQRALPPLLDAAEEATW